MLAVLLATAPRAAGSSGAPSWYWLLLALGVAVGIVVAVVPPLRDFVMDIVPISVVISEPVIEAEVVYIPVTNDRREAEFGAAVISVAGEMLEAAPPHFDAKWEGEASPRAWHALARRETGRLVIAEWHHIWTEPSLLGGGNAESFVFRLRRAVGAPSKLHLPGPTYDVAAEQSMVLTVTLAGRNRSGSHRLRVRLGCRIERYGDEPWQRNLRVTARLVP
jgi:hypothetical protein